MENVKAMPLSVPAGGLGISRTRLLVTLAICWLSFLFFLWPGEWVFPAGGISASSFVLAPCLLRRFRVSLSHPVTPLSWLQLGWLLQLVIMPVTVRLWGPLYAFLPECPSTFSINFATLLITAAYWAFAIGFHYGIGSQPIRARAFVDVTKTTPRRVILLFALLGIIGIAARYKNIGTFIDYLTMPAKYLQEASKNGGSASLLDAIGDFFTSAFGLSLVMLFCRHADRSLLNAKRIDLVSIFMILAIIFSFSLNTYNRGNFVYPLVAIAATISVRLPSLQRHFGIIGMIALIGMVFLTVVYRFSSSDIHTSNTPSTDALQNVDWKELFVLYGQGPQYNALLLEAEHYGIPPHYGVLSIAGFISEIPVIGKPFRTISGYGNYAVLTQHPEENPAFVGEIYLDWNLPGVVLMYTAIGYFASKMQQGVFASRSAMAVFIYQIISVYLISSILLGVEELSLFAVFSMFPLYLYLMLQWLRRHHVNPQNVCSNPKVGCI